MKAARKRMLSKVAVFSIAAMLVAGIGFLVKLESSSRDAGPRASAVQHGPPVANVRTVLVSSKPGTDVSKPGLPLNTYLVGGAMPSREMHATVLSDENCAPDANGVSRCHNKMRMEDGSTIEVVHPHRMDVVGCLSPGEKVLVRPVA